MGFIVSLKMKRVYTYALQILFGVAGIVFAVILQEPAFWIIAFSGLLLGGSLFLGDMKELSFNRQIKELEADSAEVLKALEQSDEDLKYQKMKEEFYIQIFDIYEKIRFETDYERIFNLILTYFEDVFGLTKLAIVIKDKGSVIRKFERGILIKDLKYSSKKTRVQQLAGGIKVKARQRFDLETAIFFTPEDDTQITEEFEVFFESVLIALMRIYLYQKYDKFSKTDFLTGLFKKRVILELLIEDFNRCMRRKMSLSVAFFDIDDFKSVNDNYGHLIGDNVLKTFSEMLRKVSDHGFFVGRYGGEEFVVIMIGEKKEQAFIKMDDIRKEMESHNFSDTGIMRKITVSCGIATYPEDGETPYEILEIADKRLYKVKESGKNRVES